ncbi:hypothetical protein K458DRAFT_383836 [Lentithecium fluviatile CBS 122367]|uniref:Uncharacterized protein n=1 Tax=Lentithecium fluviatile CBS 122367 TaxID=1168545 RepID=A0A6G1JFG5_9PLEO|nr:hypothetical protein K458DRAFT_383836 [Lentithecium fluviatile CBS 122367]
MVRIRPYFPEPKATPAPLPCFFFPRHQPDPLHRVKDYFLGMICYAVPPPAQQNAPEMPPIFDITLDPYFKYMRVAVLIAAAYRMGRYYLEQQKRITADVKKVQCEAYKECEECEEYRLCTECERMMREELKDQIIEAAKAALAAALFVLISWPDSFYLDMTGVWGFIVPCIALVASAWYDGEKVVKETVEEVEEANEEAEPKKFQEYEADWEEEIETRKFLEYDADTEEEMEPFTARECDAETDEEKYGVAGVDYDVEGDFEIVEYEADL